MKKLLIDGFTDANVLRQIVGQWPTDGWSTHNHKNSKKRAIATLAQMPQVARRFLMSLNNQATIDYLSNEFGRKLIPDPWITTQGVMFGGGLHDIQKGGFLNSHVDYNLHPTGVYRRLNLLLYLNNWKEGDGGELEIGDEKIAPYFNRCVVFETTEDSWHGHPNPWNSDESRKSLAVYYYSADGEPVKAHSTIYR